MTILWQLARAVCADVVAASNACFNIGTNEAFSEEEAISTMKAAAGFAHPPVVGFEG